MTEPALGPLLRHIHGYWSSAIFATGLKYRVFDYLAEGAASTDEVAERANISARGCQALLDGLLGLQLIERVVIGYRNNPRFEPYLVTESPDYMGGYADMILATFQDWSHLPDCVRSGTPFHRQEMADPNNAFWANLVRATAPLSSVPARIAAERLGIADHYGFQMLDVGGGAGAYSISWLQRNQTGRCVQIDWPNVNQIARSYVSKFSVSERFSTIDGDMESIDLGANTYDYVIYSNIAHGLSRDRNVEMFIRIRRWLKLSGTLIVCGLVSSDDRTGDSLLLLCSSNLLLNSESGTIYSKREYESWLIGAGFLHLDFQAVDGSPFTLVYAR